MKFFEQQQKARRKTKWLLLYFFLGIAGTIALIYFAVMVVLGYGFKAMRFEWWNPSVFWGVLIFTSLIILIATIQKLIELSNGGKTIAVALGGESIYHSNDVDEQRLLNVVTEMAIASGLPVPAVYILRNERGINAFAAGNSPSDAVIGVTDGAMRHLTRDELQGVIAHEFSHILNGDMRLNIKLIAAISGILAISEVGYTILRMRTRGKGAGQLKLFGLALLVIGSCGALFARIIQSAISRQREYLADAAAVQFTRNPAGIGGALKKIAMLQNGSIILSPAASEVSHMFFSKGFSSFLSDLFSTHPPIEKRIKAIEEMASGLIEISPRTYKTAEEKQLIPRVISQDRSKILITNLIASAGTINPSATNYYAKFISSLSPTIVESLGNLFDSTALIYALLLSDDELIRNKQIDELSRIISPALLYAVLHRYDDIKNLPRIKKLPLAHIAIAQLKTMSRNQFKEFQKAIDTLMQCDDKIDLFEFALSKIVKRNLSARFTSESSLSIKLVKPPAYNSFDPVKRDCVVLLSALAWSGHDDVESARIAFEIGIQGLGVQNDDLKLLPHEKCDLISINKALDNCLKLEPFLREKLLTACSMVVSEDNLLTPYEAELLRAIAETLECPIPPILNE